MKDYNQILNELDEQEKNLQFESFTHEDAATLGLIVYEMAKTENLAITIDIMKAGQQVFHLAMPNTSPDNDEWIKRKVKLVNRVQKSSYKISTQLRANNQSLEEMLELSHFEYAAHGGCVPIVVKNVGMVGTLTVSGLEQSQDHAVAIRAMERFLSEK